MSVNKLNSKYWTKDGRKWNFHARYKDLNGITKQYQSKLFKTKNEAKEAERIFFLQLNKYKSNNTITFKELYLSFIEYQKDKVKETTLYTYKSRIKYIALLNNIKVQNFNLQYYETWRKELLKYNISNKTRNYAYKFLKTIMNFGTKWYGINFNNVYPKMTNFTNPNELKKEMLFWTYDEFTKFIHVEKNLTFKCLFKILYFCGLRKGEAKALTWKDIDFNQKIVNINKGLYTNINKKKYTITTPKTNSSNRIIPIPDQLIEDLKKLKIKVSSNKTFSENWFIFGNRKPLNNEVIRKRKNNNCILANVKQIRIHDFRHSCASLLINNGSDITLVAKFLGHSKIDETLNTYSHMFKNKLNNIIDIINNLDNNLKS